MKIFHEFSTRKVIILLIFFSILFTFFNYFQNIFLYSSSEDTSESIIYPMPYVPVPTILGEYLGVEINETEFIEEYQVTLFNDYSSFVLNLVDYEFTTEKTWKLNVSIPTSGVPGLYSFKVTFKVENKVRETTQFKCVWLLEEWPEELVIAHLTDTHLPRGDGKVLERALYELNLLKPDVIIISGDIADRGNERLAWVRYRQLYNYSDIPIFILPGNHDHYGSQEEEYYERYGSPLYYYIVAGRFLIVYLDTGVIASVPESQLEWAESILNEHVDKVKIIAFHHPLFVKGYEVNGSWENVEALRNYMYPEWTTQWGIDSARKLLELIERYDVRLVLSGHTHDEHYTLYNEKHHFLVNLPAVGNTYEYPSYRFISIDSSGNVSILCRDNLLPYQHPSSYPIGKLTYYYTSFQNESSHSISVKVSNDLDANITPTLRFILPANKSLEDYEFFPEKPNEISLYEVNSQYIIYTKIEIPLQQNYYLTVADFQDKKPPDISCEYSLTDFNTLKININASDIGWGVKDVKALYSLDENITWFPLDTTLMLNEDNDLIKPEHSILNYEGILQVPLNASSVTLKVSAEDFANNTITKTYVFKLELEITRARNWEPIVYGIAIAYAVTVIGLIYYGKLKSKK